MQSGLPKHGETPATYKHVECLCGRVLFDIPGNPTVEVRVLDAYSHRSGRGRVLKCKRCRRIVEVIEHRTDV
jgi:hypothetical protein